MSDERCCQGCRSCAPEVIPIVTELMSPVLVQMKRETSLLSLPSRDLHKAVACTPFSTRERSRHIESTELNAPGTQTDTHAADAGSEHGRESDEASLQSRTVSFANFEARRLSVQHAARSLHNAIDGAAVISETATTFNEQSGPSDISEGVSPVLKATAAAQDLSAVLFCTGTDADCSAVAAISEAACTASPAGTAGDAMSPDQGELTGWPCAEDSSAAQFWSAIDDRGSGVAHSQQQGSDDAQEVSALPDDISKAAGALTGQEVQGVEPRVPTWLRDSITAGSRGETRCENAQPTRAAKRRGAARLQKRLRGPPNRTAGRACSARRVRSWRQCPGPPAEGARRLAEDEADMLAAILALQMAVSGHTAAITALKKEHDNNCKDSLGHISTAVAEHAAAIKALRDGPSEVARDYCKGAALYPWATTQSVLLDGPGSKQEGPLPLATLEPFRCRYGSTAGAVLAAAVVDSRHSKPEVLLRAQPALLGPEFEPGEASLLGEDQSCDARSGKSEASQFRAAGVADEPAAAAPLSSPQSWDHYRSGSAGTSQSRSAGAHQRGLAAIETPQQKLQTPRARFSRVPKQDPLQICRLVQGWQRERKLHSDTLSSGKGA